MLGSAAAPFAVQDQPSLGDVRVWTSGPPALDLRLEVRVLGRQVAALEARIAQLEAWRDRPWWGVRAWRWLVALAPREASWR